MNYKTLILSIALLVTCKKTYSQSNQWTIGANVSAGFSYGLTNSDAINSEYYGKITNSVFSYRVGLISKCRLNKYLSFSGGIEYEKMGDVSDFFPYDPMRGFGERQYRSSIYNMSVPIRVGIFPLNFLRLECGLVYAHRIKSYYELNFGTNPSDWVELTSGEFVNYNIGSDIGCYIVLGKNRIEYEFGLNQRNFWLKEADGVSLIGDEFPQRLFSSTNLAFSIHFKL